MAGYNNPLCNRGEEGINIQILAHVHLMEKITLILQSHKQLSLIRKFKVIYSAAKII